MDSTVYEIDLKTKLCYLIKSRSTTSKYLSPKQTWISNPLDAGLWSYDAATLHCQHNKGRKPIDRRSIPI